MSPMSGVAPVIVIVEAARTAKLAADFKMLAGLVDAGFGTIGPVMVRGSGADRSAAQRGGNEHAATYHLLRRPRVDGMQRIAQ